MRDCIKKITTDALAGWRHVLMGVLFVLFAIVPSNGAQAANAQKMVDNAQLLSAVEAKKLQDLYSDISEEYGVDVIALTTTTFEGKSADRFTEDYIYDHDYVTDCVVFTLNIADRKYYIFTNDDACDVFTDYGISRIEDNVLSYMSDGEYYEGFEEFGKMAREYLEAASKGTPYDTNHTYKEHMPAGKRLLIALGVGLVCAFLTIFSLRIQLDRAKLATEAGAYIKPGSFQLTKSKDIYLYRNVTSRKIEKKSGGGSTTHSNSHGGRSGGHGGSF